MTLRDIYRAVVPLRTRLILRDMRSNVKQLLVPSYGPTAGQADNPTVRQQAGEPKTPPSLVAPPPEPPVRKIPKSVAPVLSELRPLPGWWHSAGTLPVGVLEAIAHYLGTMSWPIAHSLETGCGKSTILLSHISANHKVFTVTEGDNSFSLVMDFPVTKKERLEVISGPTQLTLPAYKFTHELQFALIDGPHGYPFPDMEYYHIYPHLEQGALLVVDDIHIPNVKNMFNFLCAEEMFTLLEVVGSTAFFRRTEAPIFDPLGDGWWLQNYNQDIARIVLGKRITS